MSERQIVAIMNDQHAGHKLGLYNPKTQLPDIDAEGNPTTYTPRPTSMQQWLWPNYVGDIAGVRELAGDDEIILVHNGDATCGNKYPQGRMSSRISDQIHIACMNLVPWLDSIKRLRIITGTSAHNWGEGASEIEVARQIAGMALDVDVKTLYHARLTVGGVVVDIAHHGPYPGSRVWLHGNIARYYLRNIMMERILDGKRPPDVVMRAHYHEPVWETVRVGEHVADIMVVPSYCGMTHYSRQATRSTPVLWCGLVALEILNGRCTIHRFYHHVDLAGEEAL